jgi:hypothetical protein
MPNTTNDNHIYDCWEKWKGDSNNWAYNRYTLFDPANGQNGWRNEIVDATIRLHPWAGSTSVTGGPYNYAPQPSSSCTTYTASLPFPAGLGSLSVPLVSWCQHLGPPERNEARVRYGLERAQSNAGGWSAVARGTGSAMLQFLEAFHAPCATFPRTAVSNARAVTPAGHARLCVVLGDNDTVAPSSLAAVMFASSDPATVHSADKAHTSLDGLATCTNSSRHHREARCGRMSELFGGAAPSLSMTGRMGRWPLAGAPIRCLQTWRE